MASPQSTTTLQGPARHCRGELVPPGDKSISHRAFILAALAEGTSLVRAPLDAEDTRCTIAALRALGASIEQVEAAPVKAQAAPGTAQAAVWRVRGLGGANAGAQAPCVQLDCGNSGTSLRLLLGALAGAGLGATLTGDASLMQRPMRRVVLPLQQMGAEVACSPEGRPPVELAPADTAGAPPLRAIDYALPIASAQVKSALLLAALGAQGRTLLRGRIDSRDHTERMLPAFGGVLTRVQDADGRPALQLMGPQKLVAADIEVPGDPSSAAFFWAAAAVVPNGCVTVRNVSLNPTRLGFLRVLARMGAEVEVVPERQRGPQNGAQGELQHDKRHEPVGSVRVTARPLVAVQIGADEVPDLIDELPLVAVLACCARGVTQVRGAQELRCKESDRIAAMAHNCAAMGAHLNPHADGFDVDGGRPLHGAVLQAFADHRIAMASSILALVAQGPSRLQDAACVAVSYPDFFSTLQRLTGAVRESL